MNNRHILQKFISLMIVFTLIIGTSQGNFVKTSAFESVEYELSDILHLLEEAEKLLENAEEGDQPGQYTYGAKDIFIADLQIAIDYTNDFKNMTEDELQQNKELIYLVYIHIQNVIIKFQNSKILPPIDRTILGEKIAQARELYAAATVGADAGKYPTEAIETFNLVISTAEIIYNYPNSYGQIGINAMVIDLEIAIQDFISTKIITPDDELEKAIIELNDLLLNTTLLVENDYSKASWQALQNAIFTAEELLLDFNGDISDIKNSILSLETAINALTTDKTNLKSAINTANNLSPTDWTKTTWDTMQTILTEAFQINNDNNAKQSEIDSITTKLKNAIANLKSDIATLIELIQTAEVTYTNSSDWSVESWSAYITALSTAKSVTESTPQSQVDNAKTTLQSAIANLKSDISALTELIQTAEATYTNSSDWSVDTWSAYITALSTAKSVTESTPQSQVDTAKTALQSAIASLKSDISALTELIQTAEVTYTNSSDWSVDTWSTYITALSTAKSVTESTPQSQVESAKTALQSAIANLKSDISALIELIQTSETTYTNSSDWSVDTWSAYITALSTAKSVTESTPQSQVEAARTALQSAIANLKSDISALIELIQTSETTYTNSNDWTVESWSMYITALSTAKSVTESTPQSQVDIAKTTLQSAIGGLVAYESPLQKAKQELHEILNDTKIKNLVEKDWSVASWKVLQDAIFDAQGLLNNPNSVLTDVENAVSRINFAVENLVANKIRYNITFKRTPAAGGIVPQNAVYDAGEIVTVRANVNVGYVFDGWYEGTTKVSSNAVYTFMIINNAMLEAKFALRDHKITTNAGVGGIVTKGGIFKHNANVKLKATPKRGYTFQGWYENGKMVSSKSNFTFKATKNRILQARFRMIRVKSIKLNRTRATLNRGKKLRLNFAIKPNNVLNKQVTWKSSNKKVATISKKGVITAKRKGKTTITVTTKNNKKTHKCRIIVK